MSRIYLMAISNIQKLLPHVIEIFRGFESDGNEDSSYINSE